MKNKITLKGAIETINRCGILLVYPIDNKSEPSSLWSEFYPRSKMKWEWDSGGDDRVASLWRLREELSRSGKVVYAKWFKGRATLFSRAVFQDLLTVSDPSRVDRRKFTPECRRILETLESDSPLSTKELKLVTELRGKFFERAYDRSMKQLWRDFLIVGFGELDDGAFPSLRVGATRHLFEDLWLEAENGDRIQAFANLESKLGEDSPFLKFLSTKPRQA